MKFKRKIPHHTPLFYLYDDYGKHVGFKCQHCQGIASRSGRWSLPGTANHAKRVGAIPRG